MNHLKPIIDTIATIQRRLSIPTTGMIGRKMGVSPDKVTYDVLALEIAGVCSRFGSNERPIYKLTEKGWSMVGGKPFWME